MHEAIRVSGEKSRLCGYRKIGGLYLVSGGDAKDCGKLPVSLERLNRCHHCGLPLSEDHKIRFSRAPRMLQQPELLWRDIPCANGLMACRNCPLSNGYETGPALLIWIGEQFYPTPAHFNRESLEQGLSRRIPAVPDDFVVGETWVLLAHAKAIMNKQVKDKEDNGQLALIPRDELSYEPGVFRMFRPERIEIVVSGEESDEVIDGYVKRGLSPVKVERIGEGQTESEEIDGLS